MNTVQNCVQFCLNPPAECLQETIQAIKRKKPLREGRGFLCKQVEKNTYSSKSSIIWDTSEARTRMGFSLWGMSLPSLT